ncbi:MAG: cysteine-rich small domain-containing protein [Clostridiales bacterium]|jgi:Zn-finger protein|nr:cysteine-rich small domain-containing protein [Clostridiales bacterium]
MNYCFFQNKLCEWFPCHDTDDAENFNCIFCYCPLYALGDMCGGDHSYTDNGIKDCSECVLPHEKGNYRLIIDRLSKIRDIMRERRRMP